MEHFAELARSSEIGDRAALTEPIADSSWAAVSCTSLECPGRTNCADGAECFAELARARARGLDPRRQPRALLHAPRRRRQRASRARPGDHRRGPRVRRERHERLRSRSRARDPHPARRHARQDRCRRDGRHRARPTPRPRSASSSPIGPAGSTWAATNSSRARCTRPPSGSPTEPGSQRSGDRTTDGAKRTAQLSAARLEVLRRLAAPAADDVVWIERVRNTDRICIAPVAVGDMLGALLLEQRPVIAVSATLGGDPPFTEFASAMGFDPSDPLGTWGERRRRRLDSATGRGYQPLQASSSFDWKHQGLLYVGSDLPDPGRANEAWIEQAGDRLCRLVNAAGGRALVLCTSHANVAGSPSCCASAPSTTCWRRATPTSGGSPARSSRTRRRCSSARGRSGRASTRRASRACWS